MEKKIMLSLGDPRLKEISEAVGNKTCNKILDFLSSVNEGKSVSEISKELGIALNTVDYNIKKLLHAGLIVKDSHWWSVKGKKMPTYKVSGKEIVISPSKRDFSNLKTALLLILISGLFAMFLRGYGESGRREIFAKDNLASMLETHAAHEQQAVYGTNGWKYFLAGAWTMIALFFLISYILENRERFGKV